MAAARTNIRGQHLNVRDPQALKRAELVKDRDAKQAVAAALKDPATLDKLIAQAKMDGYSDGLAEGIEIGLDQAAIALLSLPADELLARRDEYIANFGSPVTEEV